MPDAEVDNQDFSNFLLKPAATPTPNIHRAFVIWSAITMNLWNICMQLLVEIM